MNYPFVCNNEKCAKRGVIESIEMRMSECTDKGHYCSVCGEELERTIESLVCGMSVDKTNSFYRKVN